MPEIVQGFIFKLSDITQAINENNIDRNFLQNHEIKRYLLKHFSNDIRIISDIIHNESDYMLSSKLSESEVSSRIHQMKLLEGAGTALKKVAKNVNFDLNNSICDSEALKSLWSKASMPDEWLSFYSALH